MNESSVAAVPMAKEAAVAVRDGRSRRSAQAFAAVALFEFRVAVRSRWVLFSAAGFAAATLALSYFGLSAAGYAGCQGFERTAISLLSLAIYLVPLLGLVLGLSAFAAQDGTDLVFVLPCDRPVVVLGKLAGLSAAAGTATLVGLGAAGLLIAAETGADGVSGYIWLVAACIGLAAAFVGLGAVAGLAVPDHLQASGLAAGLWLWLVFLYELALLGVLLLVPEASVRAMLAASLFGSPVSLVRVLVLFAIGADPVLGAAGVLLLRSLGHGWAVASMTAGLAAWVAVPWAAAAWAAKRRD